jgi:hypothetical protein
VLGGLIDLDFSARFILYPVDVLPTTSDHFADEGLGG